MKKVTKTRKWRDKKKEQGLCTNCGQKIAESNKAYCFDCNNRKKEKRQKRKSLGVCDCGAKTTDNHVRCSNCLIKWAHKSMEKKADLLANNICVYCQKEKKITQQLCLTCTLKHKSVKLWNTTKKWNDLFNLFQKQKGICPYSGLKINIGIDAQLDHIIPRSKEGSNDIKNLQWVHSWVNTMKFDKTHQEFIEMIKIISNSLKMTTS